MAIPNEPVDVLFETLTVTTIEVFTHIITLPPATITIVDTTTVASPIPTLSLKPLLIGVGIGAGSLLIVIAVFVLGRRINRASRRKKLITSKEQYDTNYLQGDPSAETVSLRDNDGLTVVSPLGYSVVDKNDQSQPNRSTSSFTEPFTKPMTKMIAVDSPTASTSSSPLPCSPRIQTLPVTDFHDQERDRNQNQIPENEEIENYRRSFRVAHNSFATPTHASIVNSSSRHAVRPLPCVPISRQDINLERISACPEVVEIPTPSPLVGSSQASVTSGNHMDSGIRLGKQTLSYCEPGFSIHSQSSIKTKKTPPPTYTRN